MTRSQSITRIRFFLAVVLITLTAACSRDERMPAGAAEKVSTPQASVPASLPMGGAKSVTKFFVTSRGVGRGGNLGGLEGADAHCQALAKAEGSGDHVWHAYLSTLPADGRPGVNARDRIGKGPWYNAEGSLVAANVDDLHGPTSKINKEIAVTEALNPVNGVGDTPNTHDILTGSRPDGTAFDAGNDVTCRNWTSDREGTAQVGHHDRRGVADGVTSWNSAHASRGCSQQDLQSTGGAGLFYCFAID
jgi:hypothetical protein